MIDHVLFGQIAGMLSLAGFIPYAIAILRGRTTRDLVSVPQAHPERNGADPLQTTLEDVEPFVERTAAFGVADRSRKWRFLRRKAAGAADEPDNTVRQSQI